MQDQDGEGSSDSQQRLAESTSEEFKMNMDMSLLDQHSNDEFHPINNININSKNTSHNHIEIPEKNPNLHNANLVEDDEVKIATQMAAVVLAASTKGTVSPSEQATFAKDISATISKLPPTNVQKRKKKRTPVYVELVQEILRKRVQDQMSRKKPSDITKIFDYESSDFTDCKSHTENVSEQDNLLQSNSGSFGSNLSLDQESINSHNSGLSLEQEIDAKQMTHLDKTIIADGNISTNVNQLSIVQCQLSENFHYLKNLLILTSYTCIMNKNGDLECPQSPSSCSVKALRPSNENISYTMEDENDANQAVDSILETLQLAENSYDHLSSLILKVNDDKNRHSLNCSIDSEASYETDPRYSYTPQARIIPDLLPLCNPPGGDATNLFFNACSHVAVSKVENPAVKENPEETSEDSILPSSPARTVASSFMTGMFSGLKKNNKKKDKDSAVISSETSPSKVNAKAPHTSESNEKITKYGVDYHVTIEKEMLGLTVENVLERTIVRTVQTNGAAKRAGTKVGSLVVKVGSVETENLTHFETIDELRQSQRPLKLILRRISKDSLKTAREEMGRLIRGGGFGKSVDPALHGPVKSSAASTKSDDNSTLFSSDSADIEEDEEDSFYKLIQNLWIEGTKRKIYAQSQTVTKRDEALSKVGAKLAWVLTLLVIGLEREAHSAEPEAEDEASSVSFGSDHSRDVGDAAKSVSKILHDYVQKHFEKDNKKQVSALAPINPSLAKRKKAVSPPPHIQEKQRQAVPGSLKRTSFQSGNQQVPSISPCEECLLRIGDVLHRARSFLADYNSATAALLRGEVIALLCDILELDAEMTLTEQESASSTAGSKKELMNDLGSAGSLLKLIILNCTMMRSPGCNDVEKHSTHAGNRFLAVVHRLAASRSSSARMTATSLGPVLWSHLDFPHQLQLRGVITRALHDAEVTVRKCTATVLHDIAELVFDSRTVPWLVLMCKRAQTDPDPQLRCAAMTLTYHLAEHLPNTFLGDAKGGSRSISAMPSRTDPLFADVHLLQCKLYPVAMMLAEDENFTVRLAVAAQCDRLAKALGEHWHVVIIDLLQAMLGDKDDRVRGEAVLCIPRLLDSILSDTNHAIGQNIFVLDSLLPIALKLKKDTIIDVRISLALAAGELLSILVGIYDTEDLDVIDKRSTKHQKYVDDSLIPLLQDLLQDKNAEVTTAALRAVTNASKGHMTRERTASKTHEDDSISLSSHASHVLEKKDPVFRPVLSEDQVLRLIPTLSALSSSSQWRVRQSAVEIVPALLGCTHKIETRLDIAQLCKTLMNDSVDAVRYSATECLCLGGSNIGSGESSEAEAWLSKVVMPHMEVCRSSKLSKQRQLCLKMVEMVLLDIARPKVPSHINRASSGAEDNPMSEIIRNALEISSSLIEDPIVNVRLNVGRMYGNIMNVLSDEDLMFITCTLERQIEAEKKSNVDRDVLYFAQRSLGIAKEIKSMKHAPRRNSSVA